MDRGDGRWPHPERCGRPVQEGHEICSFHEKVRAKRVAKDERRKEKQRRGEELLQKARELSEKLGIHVGVDYVSGYTLDGGGYTGRMVVPLDWLERIAEAKRGKEGGKDV